MSEERVILVDEHGRPAGTAEKAAVHGMDTPLHLAFSCYVFDSDGRFLITRRADDKKTWPGVWTNSCCGHPAPGEPLTVAVARRLRQELGLTTNRVDPVLPRFRYRAVMDNGMVENEVCPVFRATTDGEPEVDEAEVADFAWTDWTEFATDVLAGRRTVSPWCRWQIEQLDPLGSRPDRWPVAEQRELPPAAIPEPGSAVP
ncbi:isopentenyl-diphosphate Delta-isomerase [Amycolatopsis dongchuanensis]|uniref:Isopentenyl-diphosphate Delta-isomerase n=1 Tax=Amycolatopsis dongchuanensis TaxID=1070866 RepID=A0ABP9R8V1_9PSEU